MDIKTVCLGVLSQGDATGYEIKKYFEEGPFSHFYDAGYGSIYPALNRLHVEGLVSCVSLAQESRPAKKIYNITEAGRRALARALDAPPAPDKVRSESLVMMFFAHLLESGHAEAVHRSYLKHFDDALDLLGERDLSDATDGCRFVHGLGLAIYEAAAKYMTEHEDLLTGGAEEDAPEPRSAAGAGR